MTQTIDNANKPEFQQNGIQVVCADALKALIRMPKNSVDCAITSFPTDVFPWYFRDVYMGIKRVVRDEGTMWLNYNEIHPFWAQEETAHKVWDVLHSLITASCPPGGLVLDPFCGNGNTLIAARALGRKAIGIDHDIHMIKKITIPAILEDAGKSS